MVFNSKSTLFHLFSICDSLYFLGTTPLSIWRGAGGEEKGGLFIPISIFDISKSKFREGETGRLVAVRTFLQSYLLSLGYFSLWY